MKLTSLQMATFVAKGYRALIWSPSLNQRLLERFSAIDPSQSRHLGDYYRKAMAERVLPVCDSGVPHPNLFSIRQTFRHYWISCYSGAIQSLLGRDQRLTITSCTSRFLQANDVEWAPDTAQHYHQDSTIDPSMAFDIQLFYFPQEVTEPMGGTRFLPGSHRVVSEAAFRYQNIVGQQRGCLCWNGAHIRKGLWHGGGLNRNGPIRFLYKIRLAPRMQVGSGTPMI